MREQFEKNRKNRVEALEDYLVDLDKRIAEVISDAHINVDSAKEKQKKAVQDLQEILAEVQSDIERLDERQLKSLNLIEESCREMVQEVRTVVTDDSRIRISGNQTSFYRLMRESFLSLIPS